ncbi:zinc finger BED domain-containing protein 1-like [Rhagoletis pomonella]|uniref:zinc finger BED domain-containing protein 1-like n=1 Tax=Rhagoletis pomonella TaxID=28610 RepID=UPI0017823113|nr:zinc finger BED domain-containing protein 1-like [Rhagoletis pomonella]
MLERFLDMFKLASALTLDSTDSPEMLTGQEIEAIKKIVQLLKPFEFVTKEASGQNYVTLSKIIPMVSCLISEVRKFSTSIECVIQLQSKLMAECNKRFGLIEYNTYAAFGTILDPRFKNLHFQDANACGRAIQKLKSIIEVDVSTSSEEEEVAKDDFDFWQQLAVGQRKKRSTKGDEVSLYLSSPVSCLKSNPLEEWEELKTAFPLLYKQARSYLHIVATSVPCERLFSKAGATITTSRNRLTGKHLEKLLFLGKITSGFLCFPKGPVLNTKIVKEVSLEVNEDEQRKEDGNEREDDYKDENEYENEDQKKDEDENGNGIRDQDENLLP